MQLTEGNEIRKVELDANTRKEDKDNTKVCIETASNIIVKDDKEMAKNMTWQMSYNPGTIDNDIALLDKNKLSKTKHQKPFEYNYLKPLKIITYNTQGINNATKLQVFLEYCAKERAHIVIITETK
ncbi:40982_t:CDS:2 [Gigaspora margarita]|uniref:40982_t:CDS:1 n=1 Tax=Gigaspora margarita TaxID=4874 RepID=A0ABN7VBT6_GIGMA|nr:40982_t:CDS:2 [Gigaspora margarita]